MKTYLVTGGAGFIGSHVVDALVARGHRLVVVDNLVTGKKSNVHKKAIFVRMDIGDKRLRSVFQKYRPDAVLHYAAQIDVRKSVADPLFDARTNILGTIHCLELSRLFSVKKFLFISSGGAIYGDEVPIPTSEREWPKPLSPYGIAKLTGEQYCAYYQHVFGLPFVALRYPNVYGPRQRGDGEAGVVAIFIEQLLRGGHPMINGDGKQTRDYIYVADVVRANLAALSHSFVGSVNIGTGIETSVVQLFRQLIRATGVVAPERHAHGKKGESRRSALASALAKKKLGWAPTVSLAEGLQKTVAWFQSIV